MLDHLEQIGFVFKQFRENLDLTQQVLADEVNVPRTTVALFEQGRRTPSPEVFEKLARRLGIPDGIWNHFAGSQSKTRYEFESALGELVGQVITLKMTHLEQVSAAEKSIDELFSGNLTRTQAYDTLNSLLVYYGLSKMKLEFFERYFSTGAFQSVDAFEKSIRSYQKDAIRLYSTFTEAYIQLNSKDDLNKLLEPLRPRPITGYAERTNWESSISPSHDAIQKIDDQHLPYLGYISAARYKSLQTKRVLLAEYLRDLAKLVRKDGSNAIEQLSESRLRKIDSLMRELDSPLQHTPISPLFSPNPAELEFEASRMLKDDNDLTQMENTQSIALKNLSNYVSADHMDVYVATSMRTDSDFTSVNRFVLSLFTHELIAPLRLRYFNPTQSWIENRVAKGLVEALMLRRAGYTIYMAQKGDTFGKDSEASVALGQGKPVIVYVPKLHLSTDKYELDSEKLINSSTSRLSEIVRLESDLTPEELNDLDHDGLFITALSLHLHGLSDDALISLVRGCWDDFGLLDESERIRGEAETKRRESYSKFIKFVTSGSDKSSVEITSQLKNDLIPIIAALTTNFEKRARMFREVHPLALQVILSTGVLNGILVCRSIESCAHILRLLIENKLDLDLIIEPENYRLVEKSTKSTIRVISRNNLLINAFDRHYEKST